MATRRTAGLAALPLSSEAEGRRKKHAIPAQVITKSETPRPVPGRGRFHGRWLRASLGSGVIRVRSPATSRYSHLKKRLARKPNTTAYPARTSSGAVGGKPCSIELWIACTAAPSGV